VEAPRDVVSTLVPVPRHTAHVLLHAAWWRESPISCDIIKHTQTIFSNCWLNITMNIHLKRLFAIRQWDWSWALCQSTYNSEGKTINMINSIKSTYKLTMLTVNVPLLAAVNAVRRQTHRHWRSDPGTSYPASCGRTPGSSCGCRSAETGGPRDPGWTSSSRSRPPVKWVRIPLISLDKSVATLFPGQHNTANQKRTY